MSQPFTSASVIDVFCGIGGLSHGFYKEGFKIIAGIDLDASCKYPFEANNGATFLNKSVENMTSKQISNLFGKSKTKILIGCAPCRPFSTYNRIKKKNDEWKLLREFSRLVIRTEPDVVSMENVPQIRGHRVFAEFVEKLESYNYTVSQYIVFCPDYGIPQRRRRLVLFASRFGKVELIEKTHSPENYRTLRDTIYKLKPILAGEVDSIDPLHRSRYLSPLNLKRIQSTPEGGGWDSWDDSIKLECHRKKGGESFGAVYGRMSWDQPASTITTEFVNLGSGRFGHPEQDRCISIREAALIQTFPKYYRFFEHRSEISYEKLGRHIGNAVPVKLSRVIAKSIKRHLELIRNER